MLEQNASILYLSSECWRIITQKLGGNSSMMLKCSTGTQRFFHACAVIQKQHYFNRFYKHKSKLFHQKTGNNFRKEGAKVPIYKISQIKDSADVLGKGGSV